MIPKHQAMKTCDVFHIKSVHHATRAHQLLQLAQELRLKLRLVHRGGSRCCADSSLV